MTSFAWKRRASGNVIREASKAFEAESKDEDDDEVASGEVDWISLAPKRKIIHLEDAQIKSDRLKREGTALAECERYWEALRKWDEALLFTPLDEKLHEMKAQVLMSLCEVFPAVLSAQKAVELNPLWWVGHQTLGRAQLNLGEVALALKCFSRAFHINPSDEELRVSDFEWTCTLLQRKRDADSQMKLALEKDKLTITELEADEIFQVNESAEVSANVSSVHAKSELSVPAESVPSVHAESTNIVHKPPHSYVCMR